VSWSGRAILGSWWAALHLLNRLLVCRRALHPDQEVVLVVNQKNQHVLAQPVLGRRHVVVRVGEDAGLEDCGKIRGGHFVEVRLGGEDGEEIENVQQKLPIQGWHLRY
jgi:hypothetical protein